ncbi:MAG: sulfite exporter TauE/SafE family protein [Verrucomicrobiales bacterium]|nr:sulfite exporter TauE/SafE family protein [Verrucomicrobiales bacterium]
MIRQTTPVCSFYLELPYDATWTVIAAALAGAFCLGVAKTGFPGIAIINILLVAELFGTKNSIGIILPLLIVCDLVIYPMYRKYASWRQVWNLVPSTLIGVALGWYFLKLIDDTTAKQVIGGIVLVMLVLQLIREFRKTFLEHLPASKTFVFGSGLMIGISTMMANAAGSVYSIYVLVRKLKKEDFLGIGARFFLLINTLKVPFLVELDLINRESLYLDALLVPGVLLGIFLGKTLIQIVPQRIFEWLLYAFTLIAGIWFLFFPDILNK